MSRRVFFSFDFDRDVFRANQVRNSWVTKPDREAAGFWDAASREEVRRKGEDAIKAWIDRQLDGTSVTVVLIGFSTANSKFVNYEIKQSYIRGNGLLGVYINNLKSIDGRTDVKGRNPLMNLYLQETQQKVYLSQIYPTYDWILDRGYEKLGDWIEHVARRAGR